MVSNGNMFENVLQAMNINDNDRLEKAIVGILEKLGEVKKIVSDNNVLKEFFEGCAAWILKNVSSVKLNSVLNLISIVLSKLGYKTDIKRDGNMY
jgi:hypothetical protein